MVVGSRFDAVNRHNSWQIFWRFNGATKCIRVRVSALNGDTDAAERVAAKLQAHIEAARDRSGKVAFEHVLDGMIAAELGALTNAAQDQPIGARRSTADDMPPSSVAGSVSARYGLEFDFWLKRDLYSPRACKTLHLSYSAANSLRFLEES
jgi:hypothetical protein